MDKSASRSSSAKRVNISENGSNQLTTQSQQAEEASVAKFFESNSNLGTNEPVVESEDTRVQKQNLAVIRKLLSLFSLEDTKRKYETQNVVEYVLDPNDFGYDW